MKKIVAFCAVVLISVFSVESHAQRGFTIENDKFSDVIKVIGTEVITQPKGSYDQKVLLRSWVTKATHSTRHQVYVQFAYEDTSWHFYNGANDDKARSHDVVEIDRHVGECYEYHGCAYYETIGINIDDSQLREYISTGVEFKISAKSGDNTIIAVSASQIAQQLSVVGGNLTAKMAIAPLGVDFLDYGKFNRKFYYGLDRGLKVWTLKPDSIAAKAGLQEGDFILDLNGVALMSVADANTVLSDVSSGQKILATVKHKKEVSTVTLQF